MNFLSKVTSQTKNVVKATIVTDTDLQDTRKQFYLRQKKLHDLIALQPQLQAQRKFYTKQQKQDIINYVQFFNRKALDPNIKMFNPSVEEYVNDMSHMIDHILSYEFKTHNMQKVKHLEVPTAAQKQEEYSHGSPAVGVDGGSKATEEKETPFDQKSMMTNKDYFNVPIYRESQSFPPKNLASCNSWWDIVVLRFHGVLATVTFMVDHQEETLRFEKSIERAWIKIALSNYTEFVRVYDYMNHFDNENVKVRELYNNQSYIFDNRQSLTNIKEKFLNKFDLLMPNHPLVIRYAKYLYDNYQERFPKNKEFLLNLQQNHGLNVDEISDYDFEKEKNLYLGVGVQEETP